MDLFFVHYRSGKAKYYLRLEATVAIIYKSSTKFGHKKDVRWIKATIIKKLCILQCPINVNEEWARRYFSVVLADLKKQK